MIPYSRQDITEKDIQAVVDVLKSDWITQGPEIKRFEVATAQYAEAEHAVAIHSGTAALHVTCLALGLGPGDTLWTSPNTFLASANCALYCGASVDFVDIDPDTGNMSVKALKAKLEEAESPPKVLIPVHYAGQPCDMQAIAALAQKHKIRVIEDASHALGSSYQDKKTGSCQYADAVVFSFHPVKMITSGEGGMILTNDETLAQSCRQYLSHGVTKDPSKLQRKDEAAWYYEQHSLGYNYRITDIQAALGESQLKRLDSFVQKRRSIVERYRVELSEYPIHFIKEIEHAYASWHLCPILFEGDDAERTRRKAYEYLHANGIGVQVHYIPVHTQPYYKSLGFKEDAFPNAVDYYRRTLSLPCFPSITDEQLSTCLKWIKRSLA